MNYFNPISYYIWDQKYRYRIGSKILDQNIEETWLRVAKAIAKPERRIDRKKYQTAFFNVLENFQFLPGGRILAGAGTLHPVTLFNCFVMNLPNNQLHEIFSSLKEGAITLHHGGGIGYDFSILTPKDVIDKNTGITAPGPVAFMRIWDAMCATLLTTGSRRGAMMAVLRCDHPDIEFFIDAKSDPKELRHFNVSVMVTDEFIRAVKEDTDWPLVFPLEADKQDKNITYKPWGKNKNLVPCRIYKKIKARTLWKKIINAAYHYAEPGVLFYDTINNQNNLFYAENINATNPCGEIPLPAYGACNLGAINLTQFVNSAFTKQAHFNWHKLEEIVNIATRFLDNVIDASKYPLAKQRHQALLTRRIGLGLTGLADTLVMLNMRYGSPSSLNFAKAVMKCIAQVTWETSIELAKEKGSFPLFSKKYLTGDFIKNLDKDIKRKLTQGVRNSHHNTIAPTGTISLLANNVSNGIEPIFSAVYDRHVRQLEGMTTFKVMDYAYALWKQQFKKDLPHAWIEVNNLQPKDHLAMQRVMQPFIDNSISKTINIPINFPFKKLSNIYTKAHQFGLKGCTIFRPNPITGSVIEVPEEICCHCDDSED